MKTKDCRYKEGNNVKEELSSFGRLVTCDGLWMKPFSHTLDGGDGIRTHHHVCRKRRDKSEMPSHIGRRDAYIEIGTISKRKEEQVYNKTMKYA